MHCARRVIRCVSKALSAISHHASRLASVPRCYRCPSFVSRGACHFVRQRAAAHRWHCCPAPRQNEPVLHETRKRALAKMLRALAGVLATAAALNPSATTRRQLGAGLAGAGLTIVAAPPALAEVLDIPPATTKMGGLLEKYADVARGARKL